MSTSRSTKKKGLVDELLDLDADKLDGPAGDDGLRPRQRAFVTAFVRGPAAGNSTKSAEIAGYSQKSCGQIGCMNLKVPAIAAAIEAELREEIGVNLTAESIGFLRTVLRDETAPQKLRTAIALKITESAGVFDRVKIEKAKQTGLDGSKALTDMTRAELETLVRQGAAVLKAAAALPPPGATIEGALAPNSAHALEDQSE